MNGWNAKTPASSRESSMYWHSLPCWVCTLWFLQDISWCSSSDWKWQVSRWPHWWHSINIVITPQKQVPSTSWPHCSQVHCCYSVFQWYTVRPVRSISMTSPDTSQAICFRLWHSCSSLPAWDSKSHWFLSTSGQPTYTKERLQP